MLVTTKIRAYSSDFHGYYLCSAIFINTLGLVILKLEQIFWISMDNVSVLLIIQYIRFSNTEIRANSLNFHG